MLEWAESAYEKVSSVYDRASGFVAAYPKAALGLILVLALVAVL
jgi:hypothetical protein